MRSTVLRVAALAVLLLLVLASVLLLQTARRLPDAIVYYVADRGNYFTLQSVGRQGARGTEEERASWAVAQLAAGPTPAEQVRGLFSAVPPHTGVRGVSVSDGILTLDLSAHFEAGGGSASMQARLYQLLYTLTQPRSIEGVRLLIEGQTAVALGGEGLLVDNPWLRSHHPDPPVW